MKSILSGPAGRIIMLVSLITGIALIGVGTYFYTEQQAFLKKSIEANGIVVSFDVSKSSSNSNDTYAPVVEFFTKDSVKIRFTSSMYSDPPAYEVKEKVIVRYDPEDPTNAQIKDSWEGFLFSYIFYGVGGIELLIGLIIIYLRIKRKKGIRNLIDYGLRLRTEYDRVERVTNVKINGRNPYRIYTNYSEYGKDYTFSSKNLMYDPSDMLPEDKYITVYAERDNYEKYFMDLGFLPKERKIRR